MLQPILDYRLDLALFCVGVLIATLGAHLWLRTRQHGRGVGPIALLCMIAALVGGALMTEWAGMRERSRLRHMLDGIAPTYAGEMQLMGHAALTLDTPSDHPAYLAMIEAERRWVDVNPNVNDVYTIRRLSDGTIAFIVDAETDYDHNGICEGDREARTALGEVWESPPASLSKAFDGKLTFDDVPETDRWGTWISAYAPLYDAAGKVEAVLGVDYDASRWASAIVLRRAATLGFAAIVAVSVLSATLVVGMTRAELAVRAAADAERARLQRKLVDASRQAGMAEVATGVLHNVGNVLNSVCVSTGVLSETLAKSKVASLRRAAGLIEDHRGHLADYLVHDAKGRVLPEYVVELASQMTAEQDRMRVELEGLASSIGHIREIVASQQRYAKPCDVRERFSLAEVIDDAVRINAVSSEIDQVEIVRDIRTSATVFGDRHKILQILVNLIANARKAVGGEAIRERRITISLDEVNVDDRAMARLSVADTGIGIEAANLSKLFTHGFTTRADGHGFGLHFCAIAAQQCRGSLTATSEGFGHGATFVLQLPLESAEGEVAGDVGETNAGADLMAGDAREGGIHV